MDQPARPARPTNPRLRALPGIALLAVLLASIGALLTSVLRQPAQTIRLSPAPAAGALATETSVRHQTMVFAGTLLGSDQAWTSTAARGSVLVVNFWASWCDPCRTEQPELTKTAAAYRHRGVRFVGVNVSDDRASAIRFQRRFRVPYPSVFDPAARNPAKGEVVGIPTTIILDADGVAAYRLLGRTTVPILAVRLDKLLANEGRWPR